MCIVLSLRLDNYTRNTSERFRYAFFNIKKIISWKYIYYGNIFRKKLISIWITLFFIIFFLITDGFKKMVLKDRF